LLVLRDVTAEDDGWLVSCIKSAEALERFAGPTLRWPLTSAELRAVREDVRVRAWTAYLEPARDIPVGHVALVRTSATSGRLARVLIDPHRRGEGLGRQLVAAALEKARAEGLRHLDLKVFADNEPALRTYIAAGFTDAGTDEKDPRQRTLSRELP
jgi:GNAT superfamily N-acetyltransferase